ncbi:hypothetical protein BN1723_010079 [Verticillium longisporum]|uniref:Uncharacterized protein n=1 Tax=Verticillium longisporum TaxID=100787 RepID=A0A0G4KUR1_VERLO|nr:hypothetical protein BN1723_010079 [Verticillium longisporum]
MTFPELRKGTASRKFGFHPAPRSSHRRGSAFSLLGGFPPVSEEEMELEAAVLENIVFVYEREQRRVITLRGA